MSHRDGRVFLCICTVMTERSPRRFRLKSVRRLGLWESIEWLFTTLFRGAACFDRLARRDCNAVQTGVCEAGGSTFRQLCVECVVRSVSQFAQTAPVIGEVLTDDSQRNRAELRLCLANAANVSKRNKQESPSLQCVYLDASGFPERSTQPIGCSRMSGEVAVIAISGLLEDPAPATHPSGSEKLDHVQQT